MWYNNGMFMILFKIWYMIAILPFIIFLEGNDMLADFLKKKKIYSHWDYWHSLLIISIILAVVLWTKGYR